MRGKAVLVTGGTGGIGTAIAQHFASLGATVAVSYNKGGDHTLAENWLREQKELGYDFIISYGDISNFESAAKMIDAVTNEIKKIDILVNNAGVTKDVTLVKMSPDQWHHVINTNLNGIYNVTRNVVPNMIAQQFGRIINISSINGQKGQFGQTNYCAAKAAMHGFTKALAYEVARKGITVNTVSPGHVNTAMLEDVPQDILDKIVQQIPLGRLAEPIEIARVVGFLAEENSAYITGSNFSINGGQHMY